MALTPHINLPEIDVAFLHLLTITAQGDVIRLVNNNEDIVSRGDTFSAYPFMLALPVDDGINKPTGVSTTICIRACSKLEAARLSTTR